MDASLNEIAVRVKDSVVMTDTATPKPCGLDECQEMDKQLANVAGLKLTDVHSALLDEIFQCVDFLKLLIVRRVCSGWNVTISREAAPFLRQVAIAIDRIRSFGSMPGAYNIWQYTKNASTVVMFGDALKKRQNPNSTNRVNRRPERLWDVYGVEVARDQRAQLVNKVIYSDMTVYSKVFHHVAVRRVGFQTVVYRCFVKVKVAEVFPYQRNAGDGPFGDSDDEENDYDDWSVYFKSFGRTVVEIAGRDSFVLSESDLALINGKPFWVDDKQVMPNPAVPYFFTRNVRRLDEPQMEELAEKVRCFEYAGKLSELAKLLIHRFDPGNKDALAKLMTDKVAEFAQLAHPLVSVLLRYFIADVDDEDEDNDVYSSDDEEVYDDDYDYGWGGPYDYDSDYDFGGCGSDRPW